MVGGGQGSSVLLEQGSSASGSDDLRWSWGNNNREKVHNECNALESPWNHPSNPGLWKDGLSWNQSLVLKRLGTAVRRPLLFSEIGTVFPLTCMYVCACTQLCPTLCDLMDCSMPGSHVNGIFQTILEWVAISYSRGSSRPRNRTWISCVSCTGRQILYHCATWEAPQHI